MRKETALKDIARIGTELISVHWKGTPVIVKVRELSPLQLKAIASFSLIRTEDSVPIHDMRKIARGLEIQHKIVRAALVSPTYEQLYDIAKVGKLSQDIEDEVRAIQKMILQMPSGPEKTELEKDIAASRILFELTLPNDFTSEITKYITKQDSTEIGLVTKEMLLECGAKAHRSGGRPSDYCPGILTDFNKLDIDDRAEEIYQAEVKKLEKRKAR